MLSAGVSAEIISCWNLDDSGNFFEDSVGDNHGSCFDYCPVQVVGQVDSARYFNGSSLINISHDSSLDLGNEFSIELWFRADSVGREWQSLIYKGDGDFPRDYSIYLNFDEVYVSWYNLGYYSFATSNSNLEAGKWYHLVYVRDGENETVYINGSLAETGGFSSSMSNGTEDLYFGGNPDYNSEKFRGSLDEIGLYDSALGPTDILLHYQKGMDGESLCPQICKHDVGVRYSYGNSFGTGIAVRPNDGTWISEPIEVDQGMYEIKYYIDNKIAGSPNNISVVLKMGNWVLANYTSAINSWHTNSAYVNLTNPGMYNLTLQVLKLGETDCNMSDNFAARRIVVRAPAILCGNGVVDSGEYCDDGNSNEFDNCTNSCDYGLAKNSIRTCQGEADIFLYQGTPMQNLTKSFVTSRNELYVFTRSDYISNVNVKLNGVLSPKTTVVNKASPFPVKVYRVETSPGDIVTVYDGSVKDSRAIQGFLTQNKESRAYNITNAQMTYDGDTNLFFLEPGNYNYLVFDKYSIDPPGFVPDNRRLTVKVSKVGGSIIADEDYFSPHPLPVEGAVVDSFSVGQAGYYNLSFDTEDSNYWFKVSCEHCDDEDNDGVCDEVDQCPDSRLGELIDQSGCDPFQFCSQFICGFGCEEADFMDNEPGNANDCMTVIVSKEGEYYPRCVPLTCTA